MSDKKKQSAPYVAERKDEQKYMNQSTKAPKKNPPFKLAVIIFLVIAIILIVALLTGVFEAA